MKHARSFVMLLLAALLSSCGEAHKTRITPWENTCPNLCWPCSGKGEVRTYDPPALAITCASFDQDDIEADDLCWQQEPGHDPRCFYDCTDGETCEAP